MLKKAFIRIILGVGFTFLGFILSNVYFNTHPLFGISYLGQTLAGFIAGTIGLLLIPILIEHLKNSIQRMVVSIIRETNQQLQKRREQQQSQSSEKDKRAQFGFESILVDTSAIIDGRIGEIMNLGFLPSLLIVPRFILVELQHVADSTDVLKRNRGRRGLELLEQMRKNPEIKIRIVDKDFLQIKGVDSKLVRLAKEMRSKILTTDYNLNKVAKVSGVKVLNVNELSNAIKTVVLPGERIRVKVIQEGKELRQGVGYLPDGTMVVVEEGKNLMGQIVDVQVSRIVQTAAGRMIFVQLVKKAV